MDESSELWRLSPKMSKTQVACLHLNNNRKICNTRRVQNPTIRLQYPSKYLGVTIDRSSTYKVHLSKTAANIISRNNVLHNLTGSSWGRTPQFSTALVYSVSEYWGPVRLNNSHTTAADTHLNNSMWLISGTTNQLPPNGFQYCQIYIYSTSDGNLHGMLKVHSLPTTATAQRLQQLHPQAQSSKAITEDGTTAARE